MTKIDHSSLGLSSPVLFPGVREPSGASCVGLLFDLGSPRHLGGSDPLVCEGPSAHGVERGAPPAAPGVLCGGALGGQSTQAGSANQNEEVPGIDLPGGLKALHSLANVPKSWPLASFFFFFAA